MTFLEILRILLSNLAPKIYQTLQRTSAKRTKRETWMMDPDRMWTESEIVLQACSKGKKHTKLPDSGNFMNSWSQE